MSSVRKIYQAQSLFVSSGHASGYHFSSGNSGVNLVQQLYRVQTANENVNVTRTPVNEVGRLGFLDRVILEAPTATLDFSYLVSNVLNEKRLGFVVDGSVSAISGLISAASDEKNYFILSVPEGHDAEYFAGASNTTTAIQFGNGFISNYSFEASVGNFPTATVQIQAFNYKVDNDSVLQTIPAIDVTNGLPITGKLFSLPQATSGVAGQVSVIKPGDITVSIGGGPIGLELNDLKIQSVQLGVGLNRTPIQKLGSTFPFARVISFPIDCTCSINANIGDYAAGVLSDVRCNDAAYDLSVTLRKPSCSGNGAVAAIYTLKGAKMDSQSSSLNIGNNKSSTLNFSAPLSAPEDVTNGLFISGVTDI